MRSTVRTRKKAAGAQNENRTAVMLELKKHARRTQDEARQDSKARQVGSVAIGGCLRSVVDERERRERSLVMRSIAQAFWALRKQCNEALFETVRVQTRRTRYPWLAARDANMEPEAFRQGSWKIARYITINTPEGSSTSRSASQDGGPVEIMYDYVTVRGGLEKKVVDMAVVEEIDFGRTNQQFSSFQSGGQLLGGTRSERRQCYGRLAGKAVTLGEERSEPALAKKSEAKKVMSKERRVGRVSVSEMTQKIEETDEIKLFARSSAGRSAGWKEVEKLEYRVCFQDSDKEKLVVQLQALPAEITAFWIALRGCERPLRFTQIAWASERTAPWRDDVYWPESHRSRFVDENVGRNWERAR